MLETLKSGQCVRFSGHEKQNGCQKWSGSRMSGLSYNGPFVYGLIYFSDVDCSNIFGGNVHIFLPNNILIDFNYSVHFLKV
jgi:hypothetical protein